MSKKYLGRAMAKKSRFIRYLENMNENERLIVESKIDKYIGENEEYCDKGNYQHLCNIFASMALYGTLLQLGHSEKEAEDIVFNTMYEFMQTQKKKFQKLAKYGWFWPLIKKIVPLGFKKGSGFGWSYTWHKDSPNEFRFECNKCIYRPIFAKYGLERFVLSSAITTSLFMGNSQELILLEPKRYLMEMMFVISNSLGIKRTRNLKGVKVYSYVEF